MKANGRLYQLFAHKPYHLTHALSAVRKNGPGIQRSFDNLWSILLAAATDWDTGTVNFTVDALDECEESTRYALIFMLRDFYLEQAKSPNTSRCGKFSVKSRPYQGIELRFHSLTCHLPTIRLAGEDESESIGREINLALTSEVNNTEVLLSLADAIRDYLEKKLQSFTHRTYLWLKLVVVEIRSAFAATKKQLDKAIDNLSESIDAAYAAILDRSRDVSHTRGLLHIVLAAERPLTVKDMNVALNMTENYKFYNDHDLEPESSFQERI